MIINCRGDKLVPLITRVDVIIVSIVPKFSRNGNLINAFRGDRPFEGWKGNLDAEETTPW